MPKTPPSRSRALMVALAGASVALGAPTALAEGAREGIQFEVGVSGGVHIFDTHSELGVADSQALTSPKNAPLFALRLGVLFHPMFGLELEGVGIPTKDRHNSDSAFIVGGRAQFIYNIAPGEIAGGHVVPFVLAGVGFLNIASTNGNGSVDSLKKDTDFEFHGGVGAKFPLNDLIYLRLDGRILGVPNTKQNGFSPEYEAMAGLGFTFGGHAPAPPPPSPTLVRDTDGDGLSDLEDKCPSEAGPRDNGGCPDKDSDGDTVVDRKDKCPDKAGPVERDGCPSEDKDNDGIVDENDKCPTEAEDKDGFEDEDGCPDEVPATVKKFTGVVKGINFRRNSADIKASSFPLLKEAVKVFRDYPALRVEISGHTSNEGKRDFNMKLSRKRAESVKGFLVSAGVDETRIGTVGYGPDRPIADNDTKEGQEKNRRIEFRLLSTGETVQTQPEPEDINPSPERKSKADKSEKSDKTDKTDKSSDKKKGAKTDAGEMPAAEKPATEKSKDEAKPAKGKGKSKGKGASSKTSGPPDDEPTPPK